MVVIPPVTVTPAMLISSNAVDEPAWVVGTTYALGAVVSRNNRKWESLQAGNVGKTPGAEPLWWLDSGASNRMAAFDVSPRTVTKAVGNLTMTIATGKRFTDLALLGVKGRRVTLTLRDGPGGPIFFGPSTISTMSSAGTYWAFCFGDIEQVTTASWKDLPSLSTTHATIEVETDSLTAVAEVGVVAIGRSLYIGEAQYGFSTNFEDRGRYYDDIDGNPVALDRGFSNGASGVVQSTHQQYNGLVQFCRQYIGVPCIWFPVVDESLLAQSAVYGRFSSISIGIDGPSHITYNLEISGNV